MGGQDIGISIGYPKYRTPGNQLMPGVELALEILDFVFGIIFLIEVVVKLIGLRGRFFRDCWNYIDTAIVGVWITGNVSTMYLPINTQTLKLVRLSRLLRLLRLARHLVFMDALYMMTTAIKGCMVFLAWGCVLLLVIESVFALLLCQILHERYFSSASHSDADKQAVFRYFGTFSRAMLSMLELTMANWPPIVWLLSEKVSEWFMLVCVLHKLTVGFAVIGVVNAVFMQETFKVASHDDHLMRMQKERALLLHRNKMRMLFGHVTETEAASHITLKEFQELVVERTVRVWLASMGLDARDSENLFRLIDIDSNGELTLEELIAGGSMVRGEARSIDLHTVMRDVAVLTELVRRIEERIIRLDVDKMDRITS